MKYEKPVMELIVFGLKDVVTLSPEGSGSGPEVDENNGGWG